MAKYRINVSFDGENFFWIVVNNGKFIRNPTKEDLMRTKTYYYNKTNICEICREEYEKDGKELTDKSILYPGNARRSFDDDLKKKFNEWICLRHRQIKYERHVPTSKTNIGKAFAYCRTGILDPNSNNAKGNKFEELTYRWLGAERLSVKYDKYSKLPLDHSSIPDRMMITEIGHKLVDLSGKVPQTKGALYSPQRGCWTLGTANEQKKLLIF